MIITVDQCPTLVRHLGKISTMEEPEFLHLISLWWKKAFPMLGFVRKLQRTKEELPLWQFIWVGMQPCLVCRSRSFSFHLKRMYVQSKENTQKRQYGWQTSTVMDWATIVWRMEKTPTLAFLSLENSLRDIELTGVSSIPEQQGRGQQLFIESLIRGFSWNYQNPSSNPEVEFFAHWRSQLCPGKVTSITGFSIIFKVTENMIGRKICQKVGI